MSKSIKEIKELIPDSRKYIDPFLTPDEKKGYEFGYLDGYIQGCHNTLIEQFNSTNKILDKAFSEQAEKVEKK